MAPEIFKKAFPIVFTLDFQVTLPRVARERLTYIVQNPSVKENRSHKAVPLVGCIFVTLQQTTRSTHTAEHLGTTEIRPRMMCVCVCVHVQ